MHVASVPPNGSDPSRPETFQTNGNRALGQGTHHATLLSGLRDPGSPSRPSLSRSFAHPRFCFYNCASLNSEGQMTPRGVRVCCPCGAPSPPPIFIRPPSCCRWWGLVVLFIRCRAFCSVLLFVAVASLRQRQIVLSGISASGAAGLVCRRLVGLLLLIRPAIGYGSSREGSYAPTSRKSLLPRQVVVGVFKKRVWLLDETINFAEILIRQPLWGAVDAPAPGEAAAVGRLHRALCSSAPHYMLPHPDPSMTLHIHSLCPRESP